MLLTALFTLLLLPVLNGQIIAEGPPPLTGEMADKVASFFEWALDLHFTAAQGAEYKKMLARDWSNEEQRRSTLQLITLIDKAAAAPPEKRNRLQPEVNQMILNGLRQRTGDAQTIWMLAIYQQAHSVKPGGIMGKWRATHTAAVQYKNSYSGALAPTSGSTFAYEFRPDGTYRLDGTLQVTSYGCTSAVTQQQTGQYRADGSLLYIQPVSGTVRNQTCGGPVSEKPASLSAQIYEFRFEPDSSGEVLIMTSQDGNSKPDYFRRQK